MKNQPSTLSGPQGSRSPRPSKSQTSKYAVTPRQVHSRFLTVKFDTAKLSLIKWPLAAAIWSAVGLIVSLANAPNTGDTFVTLGQALSTPIAVLCALGFGCSACWFVARANLISTRLYSEYLSRQRQLYHASSAAREKLRKSWGGERR